MQIIAFGGRQVQLELRRQFGIYLNSHAQPLPFTLMLRRIIASVLVVTVLGYGSAWAFAGHTLDTGDHAAMADLFEHAQTAAEDGGCDHSCHAGAHMTGMASPVPTFIFPDIGSLRATYSRSTLPISFAPPLKPPRS